MTPGAGWGGGGGSREVSARACVSRASLGSAGAVFCVHLAFLTESYNRQNSHYVQTVPSLFGRVRKESRFQTKPHS